MDFEIGATKFKVSKINAIKQFHIVRRIAPILSELMPAILEIQKLQKQKEKTPEQQFEEAAKVVAPLLTGFSKLSDADSDYVLMGLLSAAEANINGGWVRLVNGEILMLQDLELPHLIQIAGRAFMFNLSGFFTVLPQVS